MQDFAFDVVQRPFEQGFDNPCFLMKICGTLALEMPDKTGAKVWFEGCGGRGLKPAIAFSYYRSMPWHSLHVLPRDKSFDDDEDPYVERSPVSHPWDDCVTDGPN